MKTDQSKIEWAVEQLDLAEQATIGGWTRKVSELEQHISNGGKVNDLGEFFVQSGRKTDHRLDNALSWIRCLFWTPRGRATTDKVEHVLNGAALLLAHYCGPYQIEPWPDVYNRILRLGIQPKGAAWDIPNNYDGRVGRLKSAYLARARGAGLFRRESVELT